MGPDDLVFLGIAFLLGFIATRIRLPALVGYLIAGFALHAAGYESTPLIDGAATAGVLLLLFGIGLKLDVKSLARPHIWAPTALHLVVFGVVCVATLAIAAAIGLSAVADLDLGSLALIGFALAFSSTVFAVKSLEDFNEEESSIGRIALGVLVVQDLAAVGFLVATAGVWPSVWAIPAVLGVVALRPLYRWLMSSAGHGEVLLLLGATLALVVGAGLFAEVGLKPELGALLLGILIASHPRASELAGRLLDLKDLLLVGFFLSIGLSGFPPFGVLLVALLAMALLPLKGGLFFVLFTRFRVPPRTAFHASSNLVTYSEFGLIVAAAAVADGLLLDTWAAGIAVAVAGSFVAAAPLNAFRYRLYRRYAHALHRYDFSADQPDGFSLIPNTKILVFGMGRTGTGAYDEIVRREGAIVLGVERDESAVDMHGHRGRNVVRGDALDRDFWEDLGSLEHIELIVFAMDNHRSNLESVSRADEFAPAARIAAIATHPDEILELRAAGVDVARDLYGEAGQGLADDALGWSDNDAVPE